MAGGRTRSRSVDIREAHLLRMEKLMMKLHRAPMGMPSLGHFGKHVLLFAAFLVLLDMVGLC